MLDDFQMDDLNCDGTEETLGDCKYIKNDNCGTHEGAGVVCSDPSSKCKFRSITNV